MCASVYFIVLSLQGAMASQDENGEAAEDFITLIRKYLDEPSLLFPDDPAMVYICYAVIFAVSYLLPALLVFRPLLRRGWAPSSAAAFSLLLGAAAGSVPFLWVGAREIGLKWHAQPINYVLLSGFLGIFALLAFSAWIAGPKQNAPNSRPRRPPLSKNRSVPPSRPPAREKVQQKTNT